MRDRAATYPRSLRSLAALLVVGPALVLPSPAAASHQYVRQWGGSGDADLSLPSGIDTDSFDNVYVADFTNNRIQKFSSDGEFMAMWGTNGTGQVQFDEPVDVAVVGSGSAMYVADRQNERIQKLDSNGEFVWERGTETVAGFVPNGVATDSSGTVYVADRGNHRIQKFGSNGTLLGSFGSTQGSGSEQFNNPSGLEVSGGVIYVADTDNNRIQRLDTSGTFSTPLTGPSGFTSPGDVAVAETGGNLFVADSGNNRVQELTSGGSLVGQWTGSGATGGDLSLPLGVATGSLDTFFVADTFNNRIQEFSAPIAGSTVRVSGTRLVFTVDPTADDTNGVLVSQPSTNTYTFADLADTITPGAGCTGPPSNSITCSPSGITSLRITVEDGNDTVTVSATTPAAVIGGPGDDTITGGVGSDVTASYSDAAGAVTVSLATVGTPQPTGGAGSDTLTGVNSLTGSSFGDTLTGNTGANTLTGGGGNDRADYSSAPSAVTVDLSITSAQNTVGAGMDTLSSIENLTGSDLNDVLTGNSVFNSILGGDGNDDIHVDDAGPDQVGCGNGADTVTADAQDTVDPDCETVTRTGAGTGGGGTPSTGGGGGAVSAPVISGLSAPKLRSSKSGNFKYTLSTSASVTLTIERAGVGRKAGRLCKKQTRKNRKKPKCTFYSSVGKLTRAGVAGANTLRFAGKLAGRALKPGKYRVTAVATGATGARSGPATAQFTVTK